MSYLLSKRGHSDYVRWSARYFGKMDMACFEILFCYLPGMTGNPEKVLVYTLAKNQPGSLPNKVNPINDLGNTVYCRNNKGRTMNCHWLHCVHTVNKPDNYAYFIFLYLQCHSVFERGFWRRRVCICNRPDCKKYSGMFNITKHSDKTSFI